MHRTLPLLLLLLGAAAAYAAVPEYSGTRCDCSVTYVDYNEAGVADSLAISGRCRKKGGFSPFNGEFTQCNCFGVHIVACHQDDPEPIVVSFTGDAQVDAHRSICDAYLASNTNGTYNAAPCLNYADNSPACASPDRAFQRSEATTAESMTESDRTTVECSHTVFVNDCTSTAPCEGDPVDCLVAEGEWGTCSATCDGGTQETSLTVVTPAADGGEACPANLNLTRGCGTGSCPVACEVGPWSAWSPCSVTCGSGGMQGRARVMTVQPENGGTACPDLLQQRECQPAPSSCPAPVDCAVSAWSGYTACSAACGGSGFQSRTRTVVVPAQHGGEPCPVSLAQTIECNRGPVCGGGSVDCVTTQGEWGECGPECGTDRVRTAPLTVMTQPSDGGEACPSPLEVSEACPDVDCPVDCVVGNWGTYSDCSATCGPDGIQSRARPVLVHPTVNGTACPATQEDVPCFEQPVDCPAGVDCVVGDWVEYGECTEPCGDHGVHYRIREVTTPVANGGAACPDLHGTVSCNRFACPVDCQYSDWSAWTECSEPCGVQGLEIRHRNKTSDAAHGGSCSVTREERPCNLVACRSGDCVLNDWGDWGECSVNGTQQRVRGVSVEPTPGYAACPSLASRTESRACNFTCGPADFEFGAWGPCQNGTQTRTRQCGDPLSETRACSEDDDDDDDLLDDLFFYGGIALGGAAVLVATGIAIWKREEIRELCGCD